MLIKVVGKGVISQTVPVKQIPISAEVGQGIRQNLMLKGLLIPKNEQIEKGYSQRRRTQFIASKVLIPHHVRPTVSHFTNR